MNVDTGELRMLTKEQYEALAGSFMPVPEGLRDEAKRALDGKESTVVDLSENTPLANWAKSERRKAKSNKAKMAKASKRRNRH